MRRLMGATLLGVFLVLGLGLPGAAGAVVQNLTVTATVTATLAPSFTATPPAIVVVKDTDTPSLTPTGTPFIAAPTATPAPLVGSAVIDGNFFHPLQGGILPLKYDEPYAATVTIDLYNRMGHRVKQLRQTGGPGTYTMPWDGIGDDGVIVSSGIYVAHFYGRGLDSLVKFAVIK